MKKLRKLLSIIPLFVTTLLSNSCAATVLNDIAQEKLGVFWKLETDDNPLILKKLYEAGKDDIYELHLNYFCLHIDLISEDDYIGYTNQNLEIRSKVNDLISEAKEQGPGSIYSSDYQNKINELYKGRHAIFYVGDNYYEFKFNIAFDLYEIGVDEELVIHDKPAVRPTMSITDELDVNKVTGSYLGNYKQNLYDYYFALDKRDPSYLDSMRTNEEDAGLMIVIHIDRNDGHVEPKVSTVQKCVKTAVNAVYNGKDRHNILNNK